MLKYAEIRRTEYDFDGTSKKSTSNILKLENNVGDKELLINLIKSEQFHSNCLSELLSMSTKDNVNAKNTHPSL